MSRYMAVGLGLLLGLAAAWAGDDKATAPVTRPAFEPLAGLDLAIQEYRKGLDPLEEARLKKLEDHLKQNLKSGWKPTWSHLDAKLTDKEIESLSTTALSSKLFATGLPARTLMLYDSAHAGITRLEVLYSGYKELFHRPDCWKGLVASMDDYAARLDVHAQGTANVNAITGLMTVPMFYSYPAIRVNLTGHEREIIAAHVRALKKLSAHLSASVAATGADKPKPFFAPMAPCALINWALVLGQGLSEQQYQAARAALSDPKWAGRLVASDMRPYIDQAAIVLQQFANLPANGPATQPSH